MFYLGLEFSIKLGADLVEMESAAIYEVAKFYNIPCLIIRAISDTAGKNVKIDFTKFFTTVSENNANFVLDIIKKQATSN